MTNEATIGALPISDGFPRRYTIADGKAITLGTVMTLFDNKTAYFAMVTGAPCAGICFSNPLYKSNI